jgi:hypothetical protein
MDEWLELVEILHRTISNMSSKMESSLICNVAASVWRWKAESSWRGDQSTKQAGTIILLRTVGFVGFVEFGSEWVERIDAWAF